MPDKDVVKFMASRGVAGVEVAAAEVAYQRGGGPREQIDATRKAGGRRLTYLPHQGSREAARRRRHIEKSQGASS